MWESDGKLGLGSFLSQVKFDKYWQYEGSLTTPPCSEGIKWTILEEVQPISAKQLQRFKDKWSDDHSFAEGNGNNRRVMLEHRRDVYYSGGKQLDAALAMGATVATALVAGSALAIF